MLAKKRKKREGTSSSYYKNKLTDTHLLAPGNRLMTTVIMRQKDIRPAPARIEFKGMKFLITDRPSDHNIHTYIAELKKHNVSVVVRVCEPSYKVEELAGQGIAVRDLAFEDGTFPPQHVVDEWFEILKQKFQEDPEACVAVHCVAGLGRAPVLVALALIELGLKYEAAVEMIRDKRRGAINAKQLSYLEKYKPKSRLKHKNGHKNSCCVQ